MWWNSTTYSQSRPPKIHSYINPKVSITKNNINIQNPNKSIWLDVTLQGNRNDISKSKTRNNIPTKKNLTEKGALDDSKGSNPHS